MDQESLTPLSLILFQMLRDLFPEWQPYMETVEAENGTKDQSLDCRIPAPNDPEKSISIRERGDCIEVCFSDGRPPGGAERLWIGKLGEERQVVDAAVEFVGSILSEEIVIARKSSWLLRRELPPSFMSTKELPDKKRLVKVVSWQGTYDIDTER